MNGPRLLKKHLKDTHQRASEFADANGFDRGLVSRWLNGKRRPGLDLAGLLEEKTGRAVPADAWRERRLRKTA